MAIMYVLYINDELVGPCLELIRKVCQPDSTSKPHVTVRGPIRHLQSRNRNWLGKKINEIELIEPGSFLSPSDGDKQQNTVFIKCNFKKYRMIWYKPDYPTSIPHITLYDGKSRYFSEKLFAMACQFSWHFKVHLSKQLNDSSGVQEYPTLSEIRLNSKSRKAKRNKRIQYDQNLRELFYEITSKKLQYNYLKKLNDEKRLDIVKRIYEYLRDHVKCNHRGLRKFRDTRTNQQQELFQAHDVAGSLKSRSLRNRLGQFVTPPELAYDIAKYIQNIMPNDFGKIHFADPSIGTGTFYSALYYAFPKRRRASAIGVELDEALASMSSSLWANKGLKVINDDFFNLNHSKIFNLILTNPPYVRHHYMDKEQKLLLRNRVKEQLGIKVSGLSSLYVYFLLLCHSWLKKGAIAAWLIPSEFMEVNYGSAIRKYLTEKVSLIRVHRFDFKELQFDDVLVTSAIVIFRNNPPNSNTTAILSTGGSLSKPILKKSIKISKLQKCTKWPASLRFARVNRTSSISLGDLFTIKRGIATGANKFFIISRQQANHYEIPDICLRPVLPSPRKLQRNIIEKRKDGYPDIDPQLCLIDCSLPESEIHAQFPKFWKYLESLKKQGVLNRYLVHHRNPWYEQEKRIPPPYLCTYMGRNNSNNRPFRFIWNKSQAIATNTYLLLYPRGELSKLLEEYSDLDKIIYEALLNIHSSLFLDGGRIYGGGLYKLEPSELAAIEADQIMELVSER